MVLMNIQLDNIYGFNSFEMNFSYPRKLTRNLIGDECLKGRPNFRYKKAVILSGANATGKTSLGKAILNILCYILEGSPVRILSMVADRNRVATCVIDYVDDSQMKLIRFKTEVMPGNDENKQPIINNYYASNLIREKDSYETCKEALDNTSLLPIHASDFNIFKTAGNIGYRFNLSEHYKTTLSINTEKQKQEFLKNLEIVLKTLDPTLEKVYESNEIDDTYVIQRQETQILIQKGVLQDSNNILSTGTKEGINIALALASIKLHDNGLYYLDEQFSHIQSNIEKRIVACMIQALGDNEQLIVTTHNNDMMDLNLPNHSFAFLVKEKIDNQYQVRVEYASEKLKRDTDSVRCAADNDLFDSLPDESLLDELDTEEI